MSAIGDHNFGIKIEIVWFDQDVVESQLTCSNGRFSGVAEIYLSHDDLAKMVETLKGFPSVQAMSATWNWEPSIPSTRMGVCVCAAIAGIRWVMR